MRANRSLRGLGVFVNTAHDAAQTQPPSTANTRHTEETHSLACGFPATPAMACWPICIGPMAPMPPTGAPVGRGPMPMAPGPPPTPVRLVRALMGSSRRVDNRQYYAAPTCIAEIMNTTSLVVTGPAEDKTRTRTHQKQEPSPLTWTSQCLLVCQHNKKLLEPPRSTASNTGAGQTLTDVSEVDDQPRHQRQILVLKDKPTVRREPPDRTGVFLHVTLRKRLHSLWTWP